VGLDLSALSPSSGLTSDLHPRASWSLWPRHDSLACFGIVIHSPMPPPDMTFPNINEEDEEVIDELCSSDLCTMWWILSMA
jgi:hypothetical protein